MYSGNFEDTVFILNIRIRMIRDTLRLSPSAELFLEKTLDDLAFIDSVLEMLTEALIKNESQNRHSAYMDVSGTEWEFSQILTEFFQESSPFPVNAFPKAQKQIIALRGQSNARRKSLEENNEIAEIAQTETMVTSIEMTRLLEGNWTALNKDGGFAG